MSGPWDADGRMSKEALLDSSIVELSDEERSSLERLSRPMLSLVIDLLEQAYDLGSEEAQADCESQSTNVNWDRVNAIVGTEADFELLRKDPKPLTILVPDLAIEEDEDQR